MGDAERPTESRLLARGRAALRAAVLKVAHHGSRSATGRELLAAVGPSVAIVSAGAGNGYGHPHPATLRRLERAGARVYRTDRDGTVLVRSDGEQIAVEALGGRGERARAPGALTRPSTARPAEGAEPRRGGP